MGVAKIGAESQTARVAGATRAVVTWWPRALVSTWTQFTGTPGGAPSLNAAMSALPAWPLNATFATRFATRFATHKWLWRSAGKVRTMVLSDVRLIGCVGSAVWGRSALHRNCANDKQDVISAQEALPRKNPQEALQTGGVARLMTRDAALAISCASAAPRRTGCVATAHARLRRRC